MNYHEPVLAKACIGALDIQPDGVYVDATFGGGGHSRLIMNELGADGRLLAFDQDDDALGNLINDERFVFCHHNFRYVKRFLRLHGVQKVDGILADLGVSSHQFDEAERGFSYRFEAELDMRMNQAGSETAAEVLNERSAAELQKIFGEFGEVRNARTLAQTIVEKRKVKPIRRISDLMSILDPLVRGQRNRYLAQVFQALRIEVNDEMAALTEFLEATLDVLKPGGRLVVLSYHSLEDRLVKNILKTGNTAGKVVQDDFGHIDRPFELLFRKPVTPSEDEMAKNPRSRSAKLRVGTLMAND